MKSMEFTSSGTPAGSKSENPNARHGVQKLSESFCAPQYAASLKCDFPGQHLSVWTLRTTIKVNVKTNLRHTKRAGNKREKCDLKKIARAKGFSSLLGATVCTRNFGESAFQFEGNDKNWRWNALPTEGQSN